MKVNCGNCKKEFKITPSRFKSNKSHCCSKECSGIISSKKYSKKVKVNCDVCDKEIFYKQSAIKEIAYPTCSKKCAAKSRSIRYSGRNNPKALKLTEFEKIMWDRSNNYRYRAKARNIKFDLDYLFLVDLYNKQKGLCYYSGLPMQFKGSKSYDTMSLDRVDSQKGYTKDNVVFCLNCINMLKSDHTMNDLERVFRAIIMKKDYLIKTKIKKLYKDSILPKQGRPEDAGIDLYIHSIEDKGNYLKIGSGIAIAPEIGKYFMLTPRSSSYKKGLKLYNSIGILDNLYRGEIVAIMYKTEDYKEPPKIGERIVQLIPQQQHWVEFNVVDELNDSDRGTGGFGSTGN